MLLVLVAVYCDVSVRTSIVSRNVSSSSAVQMFEKLGCWPSTVVKILSNQLSLSSEFGQTSARRAVFRRATQRRDKISPGEPMALDVSLTCSAQKGMLSRYNVRGASKGILEIAVTRCAALHGPLFSITEGSHVGSLL